MGAGGPGATSHHQGRGTQGHSQHTDPGFPSLLSWPKAPHNSPHGPVPTAATIQGGKKKKKKRKLQSKSKPGKHLFIQFAWDMVGHPQEPPARNASPARHGRRSQREMKLQRLSFRCLTEHKNPALKTKKGKRGTGRVAGEERGGDARHDGPRNMGEGVQGLTPH